MFMRDQMMMMLMMNTNQRMNHRNLNQAFQTLYPSTLMYPNTLMTTTYQIIILHQTTLNPTPISSTH
nr:hypothetical protein PPFHPHBJ_00044 [Cydia pomonella granulovirus]WOZ44820.1 hypothetical protein HDNAPKKO_00046 [Cydia pomonella granulovirus]WOZ44956.1 hypothetical protein GGGKFHNK_00044 [Cydia pomonella granulovirus]WOZ45092.1 hypothetical protein BGFFOGFG_00044 [Cydia pomonella granulovirus]WOZ45613.1 hypothetical protein AAGMHLIN_00042 [Cydia pomonella granulovirus]